LSLEPNDVGGVAAASAAVLVAASGEASEGGGEGGASSLVLPLLKLGVGEDGGFSPSYLQRHQEFRIASIRGQLSNSDAKDVTSAGLYLRRVG
jgi:hypothetical protein